MTMFLTKAVCVDGITERVYFCQRAFAKPKQKVHAQLWLIKDE